MIISALGSNPKTPLNKGKEGIYIDKVKEKDILHHVYENRPHISFIEMEQPDFIIKNIENDVQFGVEITELYIDDTEARLLNIPNYVKELVNTEKFKHKDDIDKIEIVTLHTIPDNENEKSITLKGITRKEQYSFSNFISNLCNSMHEKNSKYDKYNFELKDIDLVIYNYDLSFLPKTEELFYYLISVKEFAKELLLSKFREIYFVSKFDNDGIQFLSLKTRYLVHMFYMFNGITSEFFNHKLIGITNEEFLKTFTIFLSKNGFENVFFSSKGVPAIFYSCIKALIDKNQSFFVKDMSYKILKNKVPIDQNFKCKLLLDNEFEIFANQYMKEHTPKINLLFDSRNKKNN